MEKPRTPGRDPEIQFKPVTEGLGFHPFSNGLPYAPVGKTATRATQSHVGTAAHSASMAAGTGAVAAGLPGFARQLPRVSVPVASPSSGASQGMVSAATANAGIASRRESVPAAVQLLPARTQYRFDYLVKRSLAFVVDATVNLGLGGGALVAGLWKTGVSPEYLVNGGIVLVTILFLVFFNWALLTAQEIAFGTSLGKRLFGLRLQGTTSQILLRAVLFLPSLVFCGLGLAWSFFDPDKRCWHDIASGVQPQEVARL